MATRISQIPHAAGPAIVRGPFGGRLLWLVVAIGAHVAIALIAGALATKHAQQEEKPRTKLEYVKVDVEPPKPEPPKPEPLKPEPPQVEEEELELEEPPPPEEIAKNEPEPEPEPPPKPKKQRRRADPDPEPPPDASPPKTSEPEFTDFGAFEGSLASNGGIAVRQGSSAAGTIRPGVREEKQEPPKKAQPAAAAAVEEEQEAPKVVKRSKLDRKAKPNEQHNRKVKATYPEDLKEAGEEADVVAIVTIRADGSVASVRVVNKVAGAFAKAAREAFLRFKFEPAMQDGVAVASEVRLVYRFRLDDA